MKPSAPSSPRTPAYWETASPAEKIPTRVIERAKDVSTTVAREIADLIREKARAGEKCVLGLATGSTPTGVYDELVRLHREEGLSFKNVVTFNLDEYWPMQPADLQSYHRFMREHLFDRVDIDPAHTHIPDGLAAEDDVRAMCERYEREIKAAGGIDLQILGIGRTGHIGFNEPGSSRTSRTRLITLDRVTRKDAASDFFGEENVPTRAVTMGVGTILEAKRVVMIAFGEGKAPVVARAIEGAVTNSIAASFLQEHANAQVYLDLAAAAELERCKAPWASANHDLVWDDALTRKAVIWLARTTGKAILKLTAEDYNEHHLQDLLAGRGNRSASSSSRRTRTTTSSRWAARSSASSIRAMRCTWRTRPRATSRSSTPKRFASSTSRATSTACSASRVRRPSAWSTTSRASSAQSARARSTRPRCSG